MAAEQGEKQSDALSTPEINEREAEEIESRIAVSAPVVHEAIRHEGERELERPSSALAWSSLAAGLSVGFSFMTEALIRSHLPATSWLPLLVSLGYPVGFFVVIIGRQQLFTENTLTVIIPLLTRRNLSTLLQVIRLWSVVLISNLTGAHVIAWVFGNTSLLGAPVR